MLKIFPSFMLLPLTWLSSDKTVWNNVTTYSLLINLISINLLWQNNENSLSLSTMFSAEPLSAPLLVLTTWLLPLMLLASQNQIKKEPKHNKKLYISLLVCLQTLLIMTFSANELIMFYVLFEATLIHTLIITQWGNQTEWLNAGIYFLFYTLVGSIPLLIALIYIQNSTGTLNFTLMTRHQSTKHGLMLTSYDQPVL